MSLVNTVFIRQSSLPEKALTEKHHIQRENSIALKAASMINNGRRQSIVSVAPKIRSMPGNIRSSHSLISHKESSWKRAERGCHRMNMELVASTTVEA